MVAYLFVFVFIFLLPTCLWAHELRPASLHIMETGDDHFDVSWKVPARGNEKLALLPMLNGKTIFKTESARFLNGAYTENGSFTQPGGLMGSVISIEGLNATFTDVLLRLELKNGTVISTRLSPEEPVYRFDKEDTGWGLVKVYTYLGIQHILYGIDHLLFVACIVLIAGFRRKLIWAITGFSIAHSITLGLASLEVLSLPIPAVEAVIALSIVFMAWEIIRNDHDSLTFSHPVLVSAGFGLLHGFGFAAVLAQIGLPKSEGLLALLCFNVGVEIGQLMFIAALWIGFLVISRITSFPRAKLKRGAIYAIGGTASFWVIERVAMF